MDWDKPMNEKFALSILAIVILFFVQPARAQQPGKMSLIGYLSRGSGPGANEEIFRQGLRSLGYIEGLLVAVERRPADGLEHHVGVALRSLRDGRLLWDG